MTKLRLSVGKEPVYKLSAIQAQPIYTGGEKYDGDYEVTPKFTEEVLKTKNKIMKDNVLVHPIEVARVSNPSGGTTVYIGGITNG